jgi:hypothetical protein
VDSRDVSPDQLIRALHVDIGLSEALIDEWIAAGGLEASLEPASGPRPPAVTSLPPSLR